MRLEKLKLAGFKSFVDPTTILLPGNLVGVVGPNGCGKSNVIDAVRWVMGESSARHLRGETMADVIFNGSSTRQPVGLASVELVFDNSAGLAPGPYNKCQQISLKRQVTRDGQSAYFLNGTRCRRKDITDLFLGTGLGSRSYAIIEQGTISRLIEAKPEELRELVEEAAGISKYKERRHETELRMRQTRENLERLADLRNEVSRQLGHLERQAKKAERFIALREEERARKLELLGIRWRTYDQQLGQHQQGLQELERIMRDLMGKERELSARTEEIRAHMESMQQDLQERLARFYELGAEIGRLDQLIRHALQLREESTRELARGETELKKVASHREQDHLRLQEIRKELTLSRENLPVLADREKEALRDRDSAAAALAASRKQWEDLNTARHGLEGSSALLRSRLQQAGEQEQQIETRRQRLLQEREQLQRSLITCGAEPLRRHLAASEAARGEALAASREAARSVERIRERLHVLREQASELRAECHAARGRIASLETLQRHALGRDRSGLNELLERWGLVDVERLGERIEVAPGWESAAEAVLGAHLEAICVMDIDAYAERIAAGGITESLALCEIRDWRCEPGGKLGSLADRVRAPFPLDSLLGGVYCAEDVTAATERRKSLLPHESIVTPDGVRIGKGWLLMQKPDDGRTGVLRRERELREQRQRLEGLEQRIGELEQEAVRVEQELTSSEAACEEARLQVESLAGQIARTRAEIAAAEARAEEVGRRLAGIVEELTELSEQTIKNAKSRAEWEVALAEAETAMAELRETMGCQAGECRAREEAFFAAEERLRSTREEAGRLRSRIETLESSESLTAAHLQRGEVQCPEISERLVGLRRKLGESASPLEDERFRLRNLTQEREALEKELGCLRGRVGELETEGRELAAERLRMEREHAALRERAEQTRLAYQSTEVRRQAVEEQLAEVGARVEEVIAGLPEQAEEQAWLAVVTRLGDEIDRLGAVNLAAMQEYREQEDRLRYLDEQYRDLSDSLDTLGGAIARIDRECRARFQETFAKINAGFQRMFPRLFGGGQANLELTENDPLTAGVSVMARPPGKRNSSIHLLSGGEKALTAVALVFAVFELNPAPFCLLDEVDAPLDDANVGRFGELVKELAEKVQFLFITHNKVTMEIAQYLMGVTMREPGVSRVVAVDVDAAVELASA
jgi:chromosome segregation protein